MSAYARHNADVFSKGPIDGEEVEDTIFLYFFPFPFHFSFPFSLSPSPVVRSLFLQHGGLPVAVRIEQGLCSYSEAVFYPSFLVLYTEDIRRIYGRYTEDCPAFLLRI